MSVHATNGCFSAGESCLVNKGSDINAEDPFLFGDGFNNVGGGVYAIDWTFEHINIWFWPRGKAPSDVMGVNPNPIAWSTPTKSYRQDQGCIMDDHVQNMRLVFNIAFCGDWAGQPAIFDADGQCPGTCRDFVQNNPHAYKDAYWSINALKVYTLHDATTASQCVSTNPTIVLTTTITVTGAPTAQQPLVEVMTGGHWAVGYSVGPPKEKRQLDSMSAAPNYF